MAIENPHGVEVQLALLQAAMDRVGCDLTEVKADVKILKSDYYVTHAEFEPIKRLVYGAVGLTLMLVLTALLYLVVVRP
jgi:hypothetical protein